MEIDKNTKEQLRQQLHQQKIPEYETYLFDADGTLLNTVLLVTDSFLHIFNEYKHYIPDGKSYTRDDVASLMGIPLHTQMEHYFGILSTEQLEEIIEEYRRYQQTIYINSLELFPGVAEVLSALKNKNKKIGIVTSRKIDTAFLYAEATGISQFIDVFITPEDTEKHKPEPEPVLKAMEKLNANPDSTVFIGDAMFDIQAGNSAGVDTVFVGWSHNDLSKIESQPIYIINTMEELIPVKLTNNS